MGKNKPMTKADKRRMRALKEMGCVLSRELAMGWRLPEIHHILSGGRRMGHEFTIPLDPWYHQGHPPQGMDERVAKEMLGPSMKLHKREFTQEFGTELEILDRVNVILGIEGETHVQNSEKSEFTERAQA